MEAKPVKTKLFLPLLLAIGFVGVSSCGDNTADQSKEAELAALKAKIAQQAGAAPAGTTITQSATATVTINQTTTNTSTAIRQ